MNPTSQPSSSSSVEELVVLTDQMNLQDSIETIDPSGKLTHLNSDIWEIIASYLPTHDCGRVAQVNRQIHVYIAGGKDETTNMEYAGAEGYVRRNNAVHTNIKRIQQIIQYYIQSADDLTLDEIVDKTYQKPHGSEIIFDIPALVVRTEESVNMPLISCALISSIDNDINIKEELINSFQPQIKVIYTPNTLIKCIHWLTEHALKTRVAQLALAPLSFINHLALNKLRKLYNDHVLKPIAIQLNPKHNDYFDNAKTREFVRDCLRQATYALKYNSETIVSIADTQIKFSSLATSKANELQQHLIDIRAKLISSNNERVETIRKSLATHRIQQENSSGLRILPTILQNILTITEEIDKTLSRYQTVDPSDNSTYFHVTLEDVNRVKKLLDLICEFSESTITTLDKILNKDFKG